jgi:hypothetical protein
VVGAMGGEGVGGSSEGVGGVNVRARRLGRAVRIAQSMTRRKRPWRRVRSRRTRCTRGGGPEEGRGAGTAHAVALPQAAGVPAPAEGPGGPLALWPLDVWEESSWWTASATGECWASFLGTWAVGAIFNFLLASVGDYTDTAVVSGKSFVGHEVAKTSTFIFTRVLPYMYVVADIFWAPYVRTRLLTWTCCNSDDTGTSSWAGRGGAFSALSPLTEYKFPHDVKARVLEVLNARAHSGQNFKRITAGEANRLADSLIAVSTHERRQTAAGRKVRYWFGHVFLRLGSLLLVASRVAGVLTAFRYEPSADADSWDGRFEAAALAFGGVALRTLGGRLLRRRTWKGPGAGGMEYIYDFLCCSAAGGGEDSIDHRYREYATALGGWIRNTQGDLNTLADVDLVNAIT